MNTDQSKPNRLFRCWLCICLLLSISFSGYSRPMLNSFIIPGSQLYLHASTIALCFGHSIMLRSLSFFVVSTFLVYDSFRFLWLKLYFGPSPVWSKKWWKEYARQAPNFSWIEFIYVSASSWVTGFKNECWKYSEKNRFQKFHFRIKRSELIMSPDSSHV